MRTRFSLGRSVSFALLAACGCGLGPRYEHGFPRTAAAGAAVAGDAVYVRHDPHAVRIKSTSPEWDEKVAVGSASLVASAGGASAPGLSAGVAVAPYPSFSMGLPEAEPDPRAAPSRQNERRVGDVRTTDHEVDASDYEVMLCAGAGPGDCARTAEPFLALERELREAAASLGANVVDGARCFGRNEHARLRVWCEGVAFVVPPDLY